MYADTNIYLPVLSDGAMACEGMRSANIWGRPMVGRGPGGWDGDGNHRCNNFIDNMIITIMITSTMIMLVFIIMIIIFP